MSQHRSYPDLRRRNAARNYFGEGTDGDVVISADTSLAATQDGDMVVKHYKSLTINAGKTLTTAARCRGLLVYVRGDCVINGKLSMTGRGCKANPADAAVTANTPVAPGCGHAVPADGITIRRLAAGVTDTDTDEDLLWGCGAAAAAAETKQPRVTGNGRVIRIPRVGGAGAPATAVEYNGTGPTGGTAANGSGGGGGGGGSVGCNGGAGAAGTCFSGGGAGGGSTRGSSNHDLQTGGAAAAYGGAGGAADGYDSTTPCTGGAGNPGGAGDQGGAAGDAGTGGLLILIVGGTLSGSGVIESKGADGGDVSAYQAATGGGSGGGVVVVLYARGNSFAGGISAAGGVGGACSASYPVTGGAGGAGAVIGPHKIDPA